MRFSDSQPPVLATLAASGVLPAGEGGRLAFDQNLYLMQLNPTFGIVTQAAHGVVSVNPDKSLTYTPNAPATGEQPFVGWEEFTYRAQTAGFGSIDQKFRLTLAVPNTDPPPPLPHQTGSTVDNTPVSFDDLQQAYTLTSDLLGFLLASLSDLGEKVKSIETLTSDEAVRSVLENGTDPLVGEILEEHDAYLSSLNVVNKKLGRYLGSLYFVHSWEADLANKIQQLPTHVGALSMSDDQMTEMAQSLAQVGEGAAIAVNTATMTYEYAKLTHKILTTIEMAGGVTSLARSGITMLTEETLAVCAKAATAAAMRWGISAMSASIVNNSLSYLGFTDQQKEWMRIGLDAFQTFALFKAVGRLSGLGQNCFIAGTQVLTGQDSLGGSVTAAIEDLRKGDTVLSRSQYDESGAVSLRHVTEVFRKTSDHLRILQVQNSDGNIEQLQTTDTHPFWVMGKGWIDAGALQLGDQVAEADGTDDAVVVQSDRVEHPEGITVYNIEVEGDHTYFVEDGAGEADWVWVHNICGFRTMMSSDRKTFKKWLESLQSVAAQSGGTTGAKSKEETFEIINRAVKEGYKIYRPPDSNWVGGLHLNLEPPDGGAGIHLPVPEGFVYKVNS